VEYRVAWTQEITSRFEFRASKLGVEPSQLLREFSQPRKAAAAITSFLWLLLPPAAHATHPTPEDLFVAIDHQADGEGIHAAIVGVLADMSPEVEKKSTLKKSPSRKSS
jgi:hypothetical protein